MILAVILLQSTMTAHAYQLKSEADDTLDLEIQNLALQLADALYQRSSSSSSNTKEMSNSHFEPSEMNSVDQKNSLFNQQLEIQASSQKNQERVSSVNSNNDQSADLEDVLSSQWFKDMFGDVMAKYDQPQTPAA